MDKNKRVFHDPIHKEIILDISKEEELMVMELIETFAFQRLRRIKQLGPAYLVFHGAESSRFTHSIGVFFVARKILNHLSEQKKEFKKINSSFMQQHSYMILVMGLLAIPVKVFCLMIMKLGLKN